MHRQHGSLPPVASSRRGVFAEALAVGLAVGHAMRITLINMFRKPVTVHYPTVERPVTDRFRGLLALTYDKATGDRREMLLDKDRLHAIGLQHQPSWATGNRLRDMQAPPKKVVAEKAAAAGEP